MKKLRSASILILAALLSAASAQPAAESVATGLNGPMGLMVDPDGNVWVVDSGIGGDQVLEITAPDGSSMAAQVGDTSRILRIASDGTVAEVATLPSMLMGQEASGGSRLAMLDGVVYATSGGWIDVPGADPMPGMAAVVRVDEGGATPVADIWTFEAVHNPDGFIREAHPYGIAAHDGALLVADAGANDLLRVAPATGEVSLVAVFDGVPGMFPNEARGGAQE